ncbi:MAG: hypothetical protein ABIC91_01115 [Nanoarchaeota archaeon]
MRTKKILLLLAFLIGLSQPLKSQENNQNFEQQKSKYKTETYYEIDQENFLKQLKQTADFNIGEKIIPNIDEPGKKDTLGILELSQNWRFGTYSLKLDDERNRIKDYFSGLLRLANIKGSADLGVKIGNPKKDFIYANVFGERTDVLNNYYGFETYGNFKNYFAKGFYDKTRDDARTLRTIVTENEIIGPIITKIETLKESRTTEKGLNASFKPEQIFLTTTASFEEAEKSDLQDITITTINDVTGVSISNLADIKNVANTQMYKLSGRSILSMDVFAELSTYYFKNQILIFEEDSLLEKDYFNKLMLGTSVGFQDILLLNYTSYDFENKKLNPQILLTKSFEQGNNLTNIFLSYEKPNNKFSTTIIVNSDVSDYEKLESRILSDETYDFTRNVEDSQRLVPRVHDRTKEFFDYEKNRLFSTMDYSKFQNRTTISSSDLKLSAENTTKLAQKNYALMLTFGGRYADKQLNKHSSLSVGFKYDPLYLMIGLRKDSQYKTNTLTLITGLKL